MTAAQLCQLGRPGCTCQATQTVQTRNGPSPACAHCARDSEQTDVHDLPTDPPSYCPGCGTELTTTHLVAGHDGVVSCASCSTPVAQSVPGPNVDDGAVAPAAVVAPGIADGSGSLSADLPDESRRRYKPRRKAKFPQRGGSRELRILGESNGGGEITIEGMAVRYGHVYTVYDQAGQFLESMEPGAFANVTKQDVRFLVNHDHQSATGIPLARTSSGTLTLGDTPDGLRIRAILDVENSQAARDLAAAIDRRDIDQMSVGFTVAADEWNDDYSRRRIRRIRTLFDTSAVAFPASPTTTLTVARADTDLARVRRRLRARGELLRMRVPVLERR